MRHAFVILFAHGFARHRDAASGTCCRACPGFEEAELALARAKSVDDAATIARQNLEIAKLKRQIYGPRSERTARLLDQMELRTRRAGGGRHRGRACGRAGGSQDGDD